VIQIRAFVVLAVINKLVGETPRGFGRTESFNSDWPFAAVLRRKCFEDTKPAWHRDQFVQAKATSGEQIPILPNRPNSSASQYQHGEVDELPARRKILVGNTEVDYQQGAVFGNRLPAIEKNGACLFIVPIDKHVFHNIGPANGRNCAKEIAILHGRALR
jgi:hypothetical protein